MKHPIYTDLKGILSRDDIGQYFNSVVTNIE